ncbi:MBL fold metallo-hydrolase [Sphaerisporangium krabiense]|uniref:Glyoxylase-like metal-dependent hydrolase (Beta-lactamase superfamily II) n=1 Tax=Sphaerisporangium krabiense TaxID=763782 RepID=A0A7W9DNC2_9ACTN|nr:MBL fold metallo-hydrolase [Sphaerisporangium krabiense]MBB5625193.1 glyoxylase-like metal-dependent hydrolase (beta-lactamase superfamily II) [Sphaerisporangium krabiense]GII64299.1 MBL fold metallo-hydrolase [Sphaerisporangium krabiense]
MRPIQVTPAIWQLPFSVGHVYLVRIPGGYALIDTGVPGSAPQVLDALARLGARPQDVRQIVLTHSHIDHTGSAADLVEATGARVLAGAADAFVIRGLRPEPEATYTDAERVLNEQVMAGFAAAGIPPLRHVEVDVELRDGDVLDGWGESVRVLHVPGHTPGSVALHLPSSGVLFPGDNVAAAEGRVLLGPFNVARDEAVASFRRLAELDVETLCVPHGDPVMEGAGVLLKASTPEKDWL